MTPHEVIKDSLEKFEERFKDSFSGGDMNEWERAKPIIEYLKSSQLSLLLSVKEMAEKRLETALHWEVRNELEDLQSLLDTEINKIKEL